MARTRAWLIPMVVVIGLMGQAAAADVPPPSREEIQRFVRAYIEASNGADPTAVMDIVSRKPEVSTVEMGIINRGWEAIRLEVDRLAGSQGTHRVSLGTMDVVLLGTGYALVVAPLMIDLSAEESGARIRGAMTLVLEKSSGAWKVLHEHDSLQFPQGDVPVGAAD